MPVARWVDRSSTSDAVRAAWIGSTTTLACGKMTAMATIHTPRTSVPQAIRSVLEIRLAFVGGREWPSRDEAGRSAREGTAGGPGHVLLVAWSMVSNTGTRASWAAAATAGCRVTIPNCAPRTARLATDQHPIEPAEADRTAVGHDEHHARSLRACQGILQGCTVILGFELDNLELHVRIWPDLPGGRRPPSRPAYRMSSRT